MSALPRLPQPGDPDYLPEEPLIDFCRAVHPGLVHTLYVWTGDREQAAHLAEATLEHTWVHWPSSEGASSRTAWCFSVARAFARPHMRRKIFRRRPSMAVAPLPSGDGGPDVIDAAALQAALALLTSQQRDVLALRCIAGLSIEDTAVVLGMRYGTVRTATERGLEALRARLTPSQELSLPSTNPVRDGEAHQRA